MSQTSRCPLAAASVPFDCMPLASTRHVPSGFIAISRLLAGLPVQSPAAGFWKNMSEKYSRPLSQVGPSVNVKPSANFPRPRLTPDDLVVQGLLRGRAFDIVWPHRPEHIELIGAVRAQLGCVQHPTGQIEDVARVA